MTARQAADIVLKNNEDAYELYNRCMDAVIKAANTGAKQTTVNTKEFYATDCVLVIKILRLDGYEVHHLDSKAELLIKWL